MRFQSKITALATLALTAGILATTGSLAGESAARSGVVYTETNAVRGNEILVYSHSGDGALQLAARVATRGVGTDGGLGNQGALAWSPERRLSAALALYFAYYNFCRIHSSIRCTPAMEAGITKSVWTLRDLLTA